LIERVVDSGDDVSGINFPRVIEEGRLGASEQCGDKAV
jgi:hypothetical protein